MPVPPSRRSTVPSYGGAEERTPLPLNLNERVMILDAHADRAFEALEKLSNTVDSILELINGPQGKPEEGLLHKMYLLDQRRRQQDKLAFLIISTIAVALLGFLLRISWIVQGAKLIP